MKRREFVAGLGGAAAWPFARPLAAEAQRRVGALLNVAENDPRSQWAGAFREGLATFGWAEGRNLRIDYRFAGGDLSRLAAYAEELVNLRPEVIFAHTRLAAGAVQQRTSVIPIVFFGGGDPASIGLVRNIARPEGNMTGFANWGAASQGGRWLELFKEAVPRLTRVADIFLVNELPVRNELRASIAAAAAQRGVTIISMPVRNAVEAEHAISAFATEPDGGLLRTGAAPGTIFGEIGRLALYHHLPLMYGGAASAQEGFLLSHGPDLPDLVRRASSYVAFLTSPESFVANAETDQAQRATKVLGLDLIILNAGTPNEIEDAFTVFSQQHSDAVVVGGDPLFSLGQRDHLAALAARHGIPAIYPSRANVAVGGR